jgi:Tfp pilus assembly protein PilF
LRFKALASRHAPNAEAQDLYLRGRYHWDRRTPDDLNKAVDYFTQAIVKDPSDAAAYVGLADCYNLLREFGAMPPTEAYPRALSAAQRAVVLDDTSAEAHSSLAFATFWWSWQGVTAEREFKRALELDPKFGRGHHWYATYLLALHRYPEALDQIEQARRGSILRQLRFWPTRGSCSGVLGSIARDWRFSSNWSPRNLRFLQRTPTWEEFTGSGKNIPTR